MSKNLEKLVAFGSIKALNLELDPPINSIEIPGFRQWINWNGYSVRHHGYDFCTYLSNEDLCFFGLPAETKVRAVADGIVIRVCKNSGVYGYGNVVYVFHGTEENFLVSSYMHVIPVVKAGQHLRKGRVIGTLYRDSGEEHGRAVHLHFALTKGPPPDDVNPSTIFPDLSNLNVYPPGNVDFKILELDPQPKIQNQYFKIII